MIIESIILENFGAYEGRQEFFLQPDKARPVILIGALNGGGKTTLLDALQLGFYGAKARTSNNRRVGYKDYLRQSIHRKNDPGEGASITIRFSRIVEGKTKNYEIQRLWREGIKGIEEAFYVFEDGQVDNILTEHWLETIELLLPSGISHLFFFDGEQIKTLAEGKNTSRILGTAVHALLGLDIVDRLDSDLKILERRNYAQSLDTETAQKIQIVQEELSDLEKKQEELAIEEGGLVNEAGRAGKLYRAIRERFQNEGGELYQHKEKIEKELNELRSKKEEIENQLRGLIAGPLPFLFVQDLLHEVEKQVLDESKIKNSRILREALEKRDRDVLTKLQQESGMSKENIDKISDIFEKDRQQKNCLAEEKIFLNADENLVKKIEHLLAYELPEVDQKRTKYTNQINSLNEKIARLKEDFERIPAKDQIENIENELESAKKKYEQKIEELNNIREKQRHLKSHINEKHTYLDNLTIQNMDARISKENQDRILKHSKRVREVMTQFRANVIKKHIDKIESLVLESFNSLNHKNGLISNLTIDPDSFKTILLDREGKELNFNRLSEGEKQLLATSLLWGLARACERPIPTVIDTPLGRLDSSHRKNLIERYFPHASHQVILLSTDEEIVDQYYDDLAPYISRTYRIDYDKENERSNVFEGYFLN